jgi:hypothetical protein
LSRFSSPHLLHVRLYYAKLTQGFPNLPIFSHEPQRLDYGQAVLELKAAADGDPEIAQAVVDVEAAVNNDYTRMEAVSTLRKIGTGNENGMAALVQLLQSNNVDDRTRRQVAESLGEILQNNKHRIAVVKALSGYWRLDNNYYDLAWKCAQNMPYPDFYQAWHQPNFAIRAMQSLKKILFT